MSPTSSNGRACDPEAAPDPVPGHGRNQWLSRLAQAGPELAGLPGWTLLLTTRPGEKEGPGDSASSAPRPAGETLELRLPKDLGFPVSHPALLGALLSGLHALPGRRRDLTSLDEMARFLFARASRRMIEKAIIGCTNPLEATANLEANYLDCLDFADPRQPVARWFEQQAPQLLPMAADALAAESAIDPESLVHWLGVLLNYARCRGEERIATVLENMPPAGAISRWAASGRTGESVAAACLLQLSRLLALYRPVVVILDLWPHRARHPQASLTLQEVRRLLPPGLNLVAVVPGAPLSLMESPQPPPEKPPQPQARPATPRPLPARSPLAVTAAVASVWLGTLGGAWILGRHSADSSSPAASSLARSSPPADQEPPPRPAAATRPGKPAPLATPRNSRFEELQAELTRNAATGLLYVQHDIARLMNAISALPAPGDRRELRSLFLSQIALQNPEQAALLAANLPEDERPEVCQRVGTALMSHDPAGGADFQLAHTTPDQRGPVYASIIGRWVATDANAAGAWLGTQPQSPDLDDARSTFASRVAHRDPESAMAWARQITEPAQRDQIIERIYMAWHVKDNAAARSALESSGLSPDKIREIDDALSRVDSDE